MEAAPEINDESATTKVLKSSKSVSIAVPKGDTVGSSAPATNQEDHDNEPYSATSSFDFNDSVTWPINRCCYDELKPGELTTVEQLFAARDDAPSFMKWVVLHKPPRIFEKRLLVISSFRVWLLKRSQTLFKNSLMVSKEYQILHLSEIKVLLISTLQVNDPTAHSTSIKLRFHVPHRSHHQHQDVGAEDPARAQRCEVHLDPGVHSEHIIRLLQRMLHGIRLVFPGQQLPRLLLPPQCQWHEFFTVRESRIGTPGGGSHRKQHGDAMATAYRCFCDDLGVPYRSSVTSRLRECLDTACVDFQYCMSATSTSSFVPAPVIPSHSNYSSRGGAASFVGSFARLLGLSGYSSSATLAKEVQALARTLEHCHGFEDIVVYDFPMTDAALSSLFLALLSPQQELGSNVASLKGFTLTNVDLTTKALRTLQQIVLQSSIKWAPHSPSSSSLQLRRLDLSFNQFSVLMAHSLATILELLPSGLEVLQLEQCRLSMLSSARILSAMKSSHGFSSCLRELNLSGNTLGIEGTRVLSLWITGAFALHRLDLSRTRLQTNAFFLSFKQNTILHESSLTTLDLSYNRMGTQASYDLGDILGKTQSLCMIILRGMKQTLLHPKRLVHDLLFARNRRQKAKNKMKKKSSSAGQVTTTGLRKIHLKNILGPMLQNSSRLFPCMIDLSENNLHGAKAAVVAHLIDSAPNAMHASLRLDYAKLTDKSAVLLLHSLRGCKTLESLSLEGNGFVKRQTKLSYKRFHASSSKQQIVAAPAVLERAAADALSLLLGGKTTQAAADTNSEGGSSDNGSAHSFTHLYHHRPKKVPLKELSLRACGEFVFGPFILTTAIQALAMNTTLQMLDVSNNEAGDALAKALGAVLPVNKSLHVLYWDDNFTTVDGFFAFYEGLLRNQTLSVVQLPINDTRRILEEQKDPPREKLFSVLGKIFKVTERNQTMTHSSKESHHKPKAEAKSPRAKKERQPSATSLNSPKAHDQPPSPRKRTTKDDDAKPQAQQAEGETKVGSQGTATSERHVEVHMPAAYYPTSSRYPTTIRSWTRPDLVNGSVNSSSNSDDVLRASWDQIGALASMLT